MNDCFLGSVQFSGTDQRVSRPTKLKSQTRPGIKIKLFCGYFLGYPDDWSLQAKQLYTTIKAFGNGNLCITSVEMNLLYCHSIILQFIIPLSGVRKRLESLGLLSLEDKNAETRYNLLTRANLVKFISCLQLRVIKLMDLGECSAVKILWGLSGYPQRQEGQVNWHMTE